jgi:hypothetical protein
VTITPEELRRDEVVAEAEAIVSAEAMADAAGTTDAPNEEVALHVPLVAGAAALATAGGAWMAGALLRGAWTPRLLGLVGTLIGVGLCALGARRPKGRVFPYAVLPAAALAGAVAVAPAATGGTANLPGLVGDALRSGGLLQPPIAFDPGWRFIVVVLFAVVGAAAFTAAMATARPKLAVLIPLPIAFGAGLVQPPGAELVSAGGAIALLVAALALAYGAQLAAEGSLAGGFEARRLGRGLLMVVALVVGLAVLAQANLLFPTDQHENVVPPRRPPDVPLEADRVLFTAKDDMPGPWRVGTLDVYDGKGWLLPPVSPKLVAKVPDGVLPSAKAAAPGKPTRQVSIDVNDVRGRVLPVPGLATRVAGAGHAVEFETRAQVPRLAARLPHGLAYTVTALKLPTARDLAAAGSPDPAVVREFGAVPPAPNAVVTLLAEAPNQPFERLQFLRDRLYRSVVAAGSGKPVDVPPARVAELLNNGTEASPYEITAAEALLARWAGIPSRIGFGYHGGQKTAAGYEVHPKNGAAWLEVWFQGYGWVPFVGTPPRAKASLNKDVKLDTPDVLATDDIAMTVYVPFRRPTLRLLYETARYWITALTPFALLLLLLWLGIPVLAKAARRRRRRRVALAGGVLARIWTGYVELRDRCTDLNVGPPKATPLELVDAFEADQEHEQLAWLVTRAVWGDVRRDLRDEDAEVFEDLAASVAKRIAGAQGPVNRLLARVSTSSLREPYADDVPNVWWTRPRLPRPSWRLVFGRRREAAAGAAALAVFAAGLVGLGRVKADAATAAPSRSATSPRFLDHLVPDPPGDLVGYTFAREPRAEQEYTRIGSRGLVHAGRIWTIHRGTLVQGSVQEAAFDPSVNAHRPSIQAQVEKAIGGGFHTTHLGTARLRVAELPQQRVFLWFPPERNVMVAFDLRRGFSDAELLVTSVVRNARSLPPPAPRALTGLGERSVPPPGMSDLPVTFWCGPPPAFATPERFKQIADAGFNYVMPPCTQTTGPDSLKMLDLSEAAGLKAFVMDDALMLAAKNKLPKGVTVAQVVDHVVAEYSSHPAFAGFFLADEPSAKQFKNLARVVKLLRKRDPAHVPYINLMPGYAPQEGSSLGAPTYDDYLRRFVDEVGPELLSYDHYSLMHGRDRPDTFTDLTAVRRVAADARLPFWQIVLSTGDQLQFRDLTESEKRFEAMQTLAYGGQGLVWFTYWQADDYPPWKFSQAIIGKDGTPTRQYAEVSRINHDVRALGQWLYRASSVEVFQAGNVTPDGEGPKGTEPVRVLGDADFTVGLFADGATRYAMFANRDYKKGATSEVLLQSGGVIPEHLDKATGVWRPVDAAAADPTGVVRFSVTVGAGDGELYRW